MAGGGNLYWREVKAKLGQGGGRSARGQEPVIDRDGSERLRHRDRGGEILRHRQNDLRRRMMNLPFRDEPDDALVVWRVRLRVEQMMKLVRRARRLEQEKQHQHQPGDQWLSPLFIGPGR